MKVLLVDPSLFTAPYDAALTQGLLDAGVKLQWATRPVRPGAQVEIASEYIDAFFYRWIDSAKGIPRSLRPALKGISHIYGMLQLIIKVAREKPDIVHFQWVVIPPVDIFAILLIRRICPVVLTAHDTVPFNGERASLMQRYAFDVPLRLADHVIVHTEAAVNRLAARGVPITKLSMVSHGPLNLKAVPDVDFKESLEKHSDSKIFVLFGEIKVYKGLDLLVEAAGLLSDEHREKLRVVVAGQPRIDMTPIQSRIKELGLEAVFDIRPNRLSENEMASLFTAADCFVFPYRQIDASGVYFLAKSFRKWMIASRVGVFSEDMREGVDGVLFNVGDINKLAKQIADFIENPKHPGEANVEEDGWLNIGRTTRRIYEQLSQQRSKKNRIAPSPSSENH